jgi:hypothetical protein
MTKIIILMAVAFALAAGSLTAMTVQPKQAAGQHAAVLRGSTPTLQLHPEPRQASR